MSRRTNVGGQAVIEGVMMRGPKKTAIAVRRPDGEIQVDIKEGEPLSKRNKLFSLPIVRGAVALFDSLIVGINALTFSASFYEEEEEESKFDKFLKKYFGDKAEKVVMGFSVAVSFIFAALLFIALPTIAAEFLGRFIQSSILKNFIEGMIRIGIFLLYIYIITRMEDIRRVFEYHGAEHKSIFCYENELPLTPENAKKFSTLHPRCGTNFLFIVMIVSMLIFSFLEFKNIAIKIATRLLFLPIVAGISYEVIKWLGKSKSITARILSYPGLMLQKLTTREPDESQLEVGIAALKAVIDDEVVIDENI